VANKKSKFSYLWAFIFGIAIMAIVYVLFQTTGKRTRAGTTGDTETVDSQTSQILVAAANSFVVQTAAEEETSVSPSAFLGVEIVSVNVVIAEQLGISDGHGVLVNSVIDGSPAQAAGLQRGDVIAVINTMATKDIDVFKKIMATLSPGDSVRITYVRDGTKNRLYVTLAESPVLIKTAQDIETDDRDWGVALSPLNSTLRESFGIPNNIDGIAVLSVIPGGAADEAGISSGDVITGINQTPISDMVNFFDALSSDNDNIAILDVFSQGDMRYVPMDSTGIVDIADQRQTQAQTTLKDRIFSMFTGGMPFGDDDEEDEEGPKGGKFAQDDDMQLTSDNTAFNRPSTVPGDENTGGTSGPTGITGMNRPTEVPPQIGGPTNDIVLFVGLLLLAIMYLAYREYHRPPEVVKKS